MSKLRHHADFIVASSRRPDLDERRAWPRYPSVGVRCWFGWWREGEPLVAPAVVRDLSQGGAAVYCHQCPARGSLAWLRPAGVPEVGWIEATVVRTPARGWLEVVRGRPYDIGIRFHEICAWEALRTAMFGARSASSPELRPPTLPGPGRTRP